MTEKYFRGFHAIGEVAKKAQRIADHAGKFSRDLRVLRLYRTDYDLVARWPNAAKMHGFEFSEGVISFKGFRVAYSTGPERYAKPTSGDRPPPLTDGAAPRA